MQSISLLRHSDFNKLKCLQERVAFLTVATYDYDPWGNLLSAEPADSRIKGQPIRYAGYVYDAETKLYYLQARYYDPTTARFISRDPDPGDEDDPVTMNGYTYADDNPKRKQTQMVNGYGSLSMQVLRSTMVIKRINQEKQKTNCLGSGIEFFSYRKSEAPISCSKGCSGYK